jgi:hypothetical protein
LRGWGDDERQVDDAESDERRRECAGGIVDTLEGERELAGSVLGEAAPGPVAVESQTLDHDPVIDEVLLPREGDGGAVLGKCVSQGILRTEENALAGRRGEGLAGELKIQR